MSARSSSRPTRLVLWDAPAGLNERVEAGLTSGRHVLVLATSSPHELAAVAPETDVLVIALRADNDSEDVRVARIAGTAPGVALVGVGDVAAVGGGMLRRLLRAGIKGIVLADELESSLEPTIDVVLLGNLCVPEGLGEDLARPALSHREKEILTLVSEGFTNSEIAARLYLSESTVKSHLTSSFRKLAVTTRAQAAKRAREQAS